MQVTLRNKDHGAVTNDDQVLWRYLDFPKFLDLLASKSLKMPRASKMDDGFEGMMGLGATEGTLAAAKKRGEPSYLRHASINQEQRRSFFWRDRTYVSCWNAFPNENAGLWRIYGDDKGLVIRTTWKSLRNSLVGSSDCVETIFFGNVDYRDFSQDRYVPPTYTDQYFAKRVEFAHEHEFRLVAHDNSREHNYEEPSASGLPLFAALECDLSTLIEQVVVSPRQGGWVRDAVESACAAFGGAWPVVRSNLYQPPPDRISTF
jgi:hypothetical protein